MRMTAATGVLILALALLALAAPGLARPALLAIAGLAGVQGLAHLVASRRREAPDSQEDGAARVREILESVPAFIWTTRPDGVCDFLSPPWADYTGVPIEQYLDGTWIDLLHPDDRERLMHTWNAAVASGEAYSCEFRVRRHDGSYRWFDSRGACVRDGEGRIAKWFGVSVETEDARVLRDTLRQHAMLIELAHDPIFAWGPREGIVFWNRGCEQLYGFAKDEARGCSSRELLQAVFPVPLEQIDDELERDGRWNGELRHTTKDGRQRIISSRLQRIELDGRTIVLEANRDITQQRQAEELLRRSQRLQALGALAGGIAHDVNNIIAAIHGNADLASADLPADHPAQESVGEIKRAVKRAADLVRRILLFSRAQESEHVRVELRPVVEEVLCLLRSILPQAIELRSELEARTGAILADATQLHQVIMNLITNAAHAIGRRPGRIRVALELAAFADGEEIGLAAGRYLRLSVEDDGAGMDASTLEHIFEPFFTTKPLGQGTGLGLSVVHAIMESHGGAIRVQSEPGKGATFALYFPEASADEWSPGAAAAGPAPRSYLDDDATEVLRAFRGALIPHAFGVKRGTGHGSSKS
jgi:PAS domain S-box-containing protein